MSKQNPIIAFNFKRLNCSNLGHPRFVIDHTYLLTDAERQARRQAISDSGPIFQYNEIFERYYKLACARANRIGGKKYSTKSYRAGIAFISFHLDETIEYIEALLIAADAPRANEQAKRKGRAKMRAKLEILKGD